MRSSDFRTISQFATANVDKSGRYLGRTQYWKIYAIENYYRVIIHSILSVLVPSPWWQYAADPTIQNKAKGFKQMYSTRPWYTPQGSHDIYFVDLRDLNEIVRANANLFTQIIPDIHNWIAKVEDIRMPRNVVAHMNFPLEPDRNRVDLLYHDLGVLVRHLLSNAQVILTIP